MKDRNDLAFQWNDLAPSDRPRARPREVMGGRACNSKKMRGYQRMEGMKANISVNRRNRAAAAFIRRQ